MAATTRRSCRQSSNNNHNVVDLTLSDDGDNDNERGGASTKLASRTSLVMPQPAPPAWARKSIGEEKEEIDDPFDRQRHANTTNSFVDASDRTHFVDLTISDCDNDQNGHEIHHRKASADVILVDEAATTMASTDVIVVDEAATEHAWKPKDHQGSNGHAENKAAHCGDDEGKKNCNQEKSHRVDGIGQRTGKPCQWCWETAPLPRAYDVTEGKHKANSGSSKGPNIGAIDEETKPASHGDKRKRNVRILSQKNKHHSNGVRGRKGKPCQWSWETIPSPEGNADDERTKTPTCRNEEESHTNDCGVLHPAMVTNKASFDIVLPSTGPLGIAIATDVEGSCFVSTILNHSAMTNLVRVGDVITYFNGRSMTVDEQGRPLEYRNRQEYWRRLIATRPPVTTVTIVRKFPAKKPPPDRTLQPKQSINVDALWPKSTTKHEHERPPAAKKRAKNSKYIRLPKRSLALYPLPGTTCPKQVYYVTLHNETYKDVAEKLGLDEWRDLAFIEENVERYGEASTKASTLFHKNTLLRIPKAKCSKWKLSKLVDHKTEFIKDLAVCSKCSKREIPNDPDPMLICDGCDSTQHMSCAGLSSVPTGDWLCSACENVLRARKYYYHNKNGKVLRARKYYYHNKNDESVVPKTLEARLPPLPELSASTKAQAEAARSYLQSYLSQRKEATIRDLMDHQRVVTEGFEDSIVRLETIEIPALAKALRSHELKLAAEEERIKQKHKICSWGPNQSDSSSPRWIVMKTLDGNYRELTPSSDTPSLWRCVVETFHSLRKELEEVQESIFEQSRNVKSDLRSAEANLARSKNELAEMRQFYLQEHQQLLLKYAVLMDAPQLRFETKRHYENRPPTPSFLGLCVLEDELEAQVLNMLREPNELVLAVPMKQQTSHNGRSKSGEDIHASNFDNLVVGGEYAIFGCATLFDAKRDDFLPIDLASNGSLRVAQNRLMSMLLRNGQPILVTAPSVPTSVKLRGDENLQYVARCFDLSELVRDCNCPLENMPKAPTPKRLLDHGLVLRDYQQLSLQWMLDKEKNTTGMGFAGELWCRMQCLDGSGQYFFCESTGSFVKDIFDFKSDVAQTTASKHCGSLPAGGILGEEMGLGKTVISLALICANPPPLHNRVLPREHIAPIDHPLYTTPPSVVGCTASTSKNILLSNGTVVISPMTLQSQWSEEIKRFAPWMSLLTLHNDENSTVEEIASKDVVLISTFLLQNQISSRNVSKNHTRRFVSQKHQRQHNLLSKLKRIHFHRCILDESHYNQSGVRVKESLASMSSTFRFCVTGTPIGRSLDDLQGQLRFLRVPQFCRSTFWKENIGTQYCERNYDSLRVLRSLLSRVVIRHSKEQTLSDGTAMLTLPPRTVETVLLPFGSEAEQRLYDELESRNLKRFMELRSESPKTVLAKYMELNGLIYGARKACAHAQLINLGSIQKYNARLAFEKQYISGWKQGRSPLRPVKALTHGEILERAVESARPSAKDRMREAILELHDGKIDLVECPVCLEPTGECDIALTPCAHKFCAECIINVLDGASSTREAKGRCPECREVIRRSELTFLADAKKEVKGKGDEEKKPAPKEDENKSLLAVSHVLEKVNGFQLSSKDVVGATTSSSTPRNSYKYLTKSQKRCLQAHCHSIDPEFLADHEKASSCLGTKTSRLIEEINSMFNKDPKSKCVVFSQFIGALDIAAEELGARGIRFVRIDGSMKQHKRADALLEFSSNPSTRVFFLSMRSGAAGLNLMAADHCFILDAPMNSAIEEQAIDRIHRIGQARPVVVKRFIIKGSIEERILGNRRSLATDRPTCAGLTGIDGTGILNEELDLLERSTKRPRLDTNSINETEMDATSFQRLKLLEALFGCSATARVSKA